MQDSFKSRESQFEAKFAHDEDVKFKIRAHRNKLFAAWVADQMGDGAPPDYADSLIEFALVSGSPDVIEKALQDLHNHGVALANTKIRKAYHQCEERARLDVMNTLMPTG